MKSSIFSSVSSSVIVVKGLGLSLGLGIGDLGLGMGMGMGNSDSASVISWATTHHPPTTMKECSDKQVPLVNMSQDGQGGQQQ